MLNLAPRVWKLRHRFGIATPRLTIQSQIPWYWRWIGIAVLLGISAASAAWIYDAGRRFAGFDRSEVQEELRATRSALEDARAELDRLRAITKDRKSTRLNSSHVAISYAVFCLKKKKPE